MRGSSGGGNQEVPFVPHPDPQQPPYPMFLLSHLSQLGVSSRAKTGPPQPPSTAIDALHHHVPDVLLGKEKRGQCALQRKEQGGTGRQQRAS